MVGIFWAIWHFPFLIWLYLHEMGFEPWIVPLSLFGYVFLTIPSAIIHVWIYNNTRSVFMNVLFHAAGNVFTFMILGGVADPMTAIYTAIITWIIAGVLGKKYGKDTLVSLTDAEKETRVEKKARKASDARQDDPD